MYLFHGIKPKALSEYMFIAYTDSKTCCIKQYELKKKFLKIQYKLKFSF